MRSSFLNPAQLKVCSQIFDAKLMDVIKCINEGEIRDGIRLENGILRFTPSLSYASGNFSRLRENHAKLQLDSINHTNDRLETILSRTNWDKKFFSGKLILECGCGAGADTEVLRSLGAKVVSVDIAGLDVCKTNLQDCGKTGSLLFQADITNLPFTKGTFDIVWCHRVLQHTPDPKKTLDHILKFARPGGDVFVHSYSQSFLQIFNWKYFLRPITKRVDSERLYQFIKWYCPYLYRFTSGVGRIKPGWVGRRLFLLCYIFLPIRNYRFHPKFSGLHDAQMIDYAIHDTFDALSPKYDKPIGVNAMKQIAKSNLAKEFEVVDSGCTLLRTIVEDNG